MEFTDNREHIVADLDQYGVTLSEDGKKKKFIPWGEDAEARAAAETAQQTADDATEDAAAAQQTADDAAAAAAAAQQAADNAATAAAAAQQTADRAEDDAAAAQQSADDASSVAEAAQQTADAAAAAAQQTADDCVKKQSSSMQTAGKELQSTEYLSGKGWKLDDGAVTVKNTRGDLTKVVARGVINAMSSGYSMRALIGDSGSTEFDGHSIILSIVDPDDGLETCSFELCSNGAIYYEKGGDYYKIVNSPH